MTPLIYSFDIFDTLVVRACGAPSVVVAEVRGYAGD